MREAGAHRARILRRRLQALEQGRRQPVTEADLAVDTFLHDRLTAARPDYGWLSEESADDPARLDATQRLHRRSHRRHRRLSQEPAAFHHLRRRGARRAGPCCGVVHNPISDELYGARAAAAPIATALPSMSSARKALEGCAMLGRPQPADRGALAADACGDAQLRRLSRRLVADGSSDATVSLSAKRDWDLAAADIILSEAGGRLTRRRWRHTDLQPRRTAASPAWSAANPAPSCREIVALLRQ